MRAPTLPRHLIGALTLGTLTAAVLTVSGPAVAAPAGYTVTGFDLASYQHLSAATIDWSQVTSAGYRFVTVKATEGTWYVNPFYPADQDGALTHNLASAPYHFYKTVHYSAGGIDARATGAQQAQYFINTTRASGGAALSTHPWLSRSPLAWEKSTIDRAGSDEAPRTTR